MSPTVIPILPSRDFDATAAFYLRLDFAEQGRWPGEYLILHNPVGIELHFWLKARLDPADNDAGCYVRFAKSVDAQALYDAWSATGLDTDRLRAPVETEYGLLEFALLDQGF